MSRPGGDGVLSGGTFVQDTNVITQLRALMPEHAVTWSEAHSIAERQATLLLELLHVDEPAVPQFVRYFEPARRRSRPPARLADLRHGGPGALALADRP